MKVLIVKVSALGDVVHALPVLAYLKDVDADMEIDWLVEQGFAPLLQGHPLIRKVHGLDTKGWRRAGGITPLVGAMRTLRLLRGEKYDVVLDLQGNSKSGLFTWLSGAALRFGFGRNGVREWLNLLATNRRVSLTAEDHHVTDRSLAVARAAFASGGKAPLAGPLPVAAKALEAVERQLLQEGLDRGGRVVLHYGTTWNTKLWPLDLWKQLCNRLCTELPVRPILTWGNEIERSAVEAINDSCNGRAVIWPRGSLPELVALLNSVDLVVGADTGPVHIASAVGTSTVSIFRVTDASRNGPRGERHIRLQVDLDCSPCLQKACERDHECGQNISVEAVFNAVVSLSGLKNES